jgi:hypothetical protein
MLLLLISLNVANADCGIPSLTKEIELADYIFIGVAESIVNPPSTDIPERPAEFSNNIAEEQAQTLPFEGSDTREAPFKTAATKITFEISEVFKGTSTNSIEVITPPPGDPFNFEFKLATKYLVFAETIASISKRTFSIPQESNLVTNCGLTMEIMQQSGNSKSQPILDILRKGE